MVLPGDKFGKVEPDFAEVWPDFAEVGRLVDGGHFEWVGRTRKAGPISAKSVYS
jgi:hypothetical protein